jgi:hypothetical protein
VLVVEDVVVVVVVVVLIVDVVVVVVVVVVDVVVVVVVSSTSQRLLPLSSRQHLSLRVTFGSGHLLSVHPENKVSDKTARVKKRILLFIFYHLLRHKNLSLNRCMFFSGVF